MRYRIIATLKTTGKVLEVEFPDREAVEAQLRTIAHLRKYRWGLPEIYWVTTTGERWCLGIYDFDGELIVDPVEPVAVS